MKQQKKQEDIFMKMGESKVEGKNAGRPLYASHAFV